MNEINSITLILFFTFFITLGLGTFMIFLKYKTIFKWKTNLIVITSGLICATLILWIISLFFDINIVMIIGIIFTTPIISYGLVATKVFLDKGKRDINLDERRK